MSDTASLVNSVLSVQNVEYRRLGDVATIVRGKGLQKKDFTESGVGCIHYGQIYTSFGPYTEKTLTFVNPDDVPKFTTVSKGDIIMAVTGENSEDICKAVAWLGVEDIVTGGHSAVIKHCLDPKYLSYYFQSEAFFQQKKALAHGTKVIEVTPSDLEDVLIPVPSMEVQRAIVEILDQFSHLLTNISGEVPLRDDQLITYSQIVLSSDFIRTFGLEPTVCNLSEVAKVTTGDRVTKSEIRNDVGYPVMSGGVTPMGYYSNYNREANTVTVVRYGSAGFVNWIDTKFWANDVCYTMECSDKVIPRYLYYALKVNEKYLYSIRTNAIPSHLQREDLESLQIFVPDIQTQQKIVNLLDSFHKLALVRRNELRDRLAQFEYYRDLILSFGGIKS